MIPRFASTILHAASLPGTWLLLPAAASADRPNIVLLMGDDPGR